jgi:hypothetical protein
MIRKNCSSSMTAIAEPVGFHAMLVYVNVFDGRKSFAKRVGASSNEMPSVPATASCASLLGSNCIIVISSAIVVITGAGDTAERS